MKKVKNISVGFLVSFLGSIPLGYLNLAGLEIYSKSGLHDLIFFLLGVVFVETFVIYFTLLFAKQIVKNKRLMKLIDLFSVVFMFVLAFVFYWVFKTDTKSDDILRQYLIYSPFVIGLILNCFNFLQVPFWTGWNLYLLNGNYIAVERKLKYYYVAGTLIGVFLGMFSLIILLQAVFEQANQFSKLILPVFIPLFFIVLAGIQLIKIHNKYFNGPDVTLK